MKKKRKKILICILICTFTILITDRCSYKYNNKFINLNIYYYNIIILSKLFKINSTYSHGLQLVNLLLFSC
jgi:hypothetical protein